MASSSSSSFMWPILPAHLLPAFTAAFLAVPAFYALLQDRYKTRKQRAWIATALASGCVTLGSLLFFSDYVQSGFSPAGIQHRPWLSENICASFMGYLLVDLILGACLYREHVSLVMGWIHHTVYFLLVSYVLYRGWAHMFAFMAIMELPTHLLAVASLEPRLRSDYLFATTFFLFRIAFHILAIVQYSLPSVRSELLGGYGVWGPAALMFTALPMHVIWFKSCITGILRRAKQKRDRSAAAAKAEANGVPAPFALPTPAAEKTLAQTTATVLNPIPIPTGPMSPPLTPRARPSLASSLPRSPSLLSLPSITLNLPSREDLRNRLSKEGRADAMRRLGEVWGAGRGVVRRVVPGMRPGPIEREEIDRRDVMVY